MRRRYLFRFTAVSPNMLPDVEDTQAADFQQILQQIRTGAVEHVGRDLGEFRRVVGDQTMTAGHQLQREFAFSGARVARDEHADGIDLHEHAVHREPRREFSREVVLQMIEQFVPASRRTATAACRTPPRRRADPQGRAVLLLITIASGRNWMILSIVSLRWRGSSASSHASSSVPRICTLLG